MAAFLGLAAAVARGSPGQLQPEQSQPFLQTAQRLLPEAWDCRRQHALCQLDACGELTREQQLNANFAEQLKPRPAVRARSCPLIIQDALRDPERGSAVAVPTCGKKQVSQDTCYPLHTDAPCHGHRLRVSGHRAPRKMQPAVVDVQQPETAAPPAALTRAPLRIEP
eukprot:scaffold77516_cov51-Phaeocystis_antarctica.AAC.1